MGPIELYEHLEQSVTELNHNMLSPNLHKDAEGIDLDRLKWEVTASRVGFRSGKIESYFTAPVMVKDKIKTQQYPDLELLGDGAFEYFKDRAQTAKNLFLIIRYNQILFNSSHRRNQQGEKVIDSSISILSTAEVIEVEDAFRYWDVLLNAFFLSLRCKKYRFSELTGLIFQMILVHSGYYRDLNNLVNGINSNRKRIPKELQRRIHDAVLPLTVDSVLAGDTMMIEHLLMSLSKLGSSLGDDTRLYHIACGEAYENRADIQIGELNNMSASISLVSAMTYYQRAGNREKLDAAGLKYAEIKHNVGLTKIRLGGKDYIRDETTEYFRAIIDHVESIPDEGIYHFLSRSKRVLPYTGSLAESEDEPDTLTLLDAFTNARYDINANARVDKGGKNKNKLFENYSMEFKMFYAHVLYATFRHGISSGSISFPSLLDYLIEHSWLGQVLEDTTDAGHPRLHSWAFELSHYLMQFFMQIEAIVLQPAIPTNFQACTEGLSLKMEPILRDLVQKLNINTLKIPKEYVIREMHLEELIQRLTEFDVIDQQNIMFLRYMYTSNGKNIRNNVAHGFLRPYQFPPFECFLVIFSLLRISAFRFVKE